MGEEVKPDEGKKVDQETADTAAQIVKAHEDNSKLGRKVSAMADQIASLSQMISQVTTQQTDFMESVKSQQQSQQTDGDDYGYASKKEADAAAMSIYNKMEQEKQAKEKKYSDGYVSTLMGLSQTEEPEMFEAIKTEIQKPGYVKHSQDPALDAQINFNKAKSQVLADRLKASSGKINNPLEANRNKPPMNGTGVGGNGVNDPGASKEIPLDKESARFVELMKERDSEYTDEVVQAALSKEDSVGLARGTGV